MVESPKQIVGSKACKLTTGRAINSIVMDEYGEVIFNELLRGYS